MATRQTFFLEKPGGGSKPPRKNNSNYKSSLVFGLRANGPTQSGYTEAFADRSKEAASDPNQPTESFETTHFRNMYQSSIHFANSWKQPPPVYKHMPLSGSEEEKELLAAQRAGTAPVGGGGGGGGGGERVGPSPDPGTGTSETRDAQSRTAMLPTDQLVALTADHAADAKRNRDSSKSSTLKLGREKHDLFSSNAHSKYYKDISKERRFMHDPAHAHWLYMKQNATADPAALAAAGAAGTGGLEELKAAPIANDGVEPPAGEAFGPLSKDGPTGRGGRIRKPHANFKSN